MDDTVGASTTAERFEPRPETVGAARRFVVRALADLGDVADDAALLVSELATNAVIHAATAYEVTVRRLGDSVRVEVTDASPAAARRSRYGPTSGTGRGLGMVEDLAAQWGVHAVATGKVVWFELPVHRRAAGDDGERGGDLAHHHDADADLDALLDELGGWDDDGRARDLAA
jgi:anti-sigma regulatory factor (Ser/Thr protein kinase)